MGILSKKMKKAGWPIMRTATGGWVVHASDAREYRYDPSSGWNVQEKDIETELDRDLQKIKQGTLSAIQTLSRTTALDHTRNPSQPIARICRDGLVEGKSVLHLGTGLDRFAKETLRDAGAELVADYDPNFYPDRAVLQRKYDVVLCHYVLNILPPKERRKVYSTIAKCTDSQGVAYICVQGKWPVLNRHKVVRAHEDGYLIRDSAVPTFRKGYDSEELIEEIQRQIQGHAELLCMFYSNSLVQWHPQRDRLIE